MTTLQCLDLAVAITATPTILGDEFAVLYRGCERPDVRVSSDVELGLHHRDNLYTASVNDVATATCVCRRDLFLHASMEIDHACVAASAHSHLMIHASCVARGYRAALIVGPSSAGKSTLAAALTLAGLDYLGDEVIGIRAGASSVSAYPKPFRLDQRARQLLGEAFGRGDLCTNDAPGEELVAPTACGSTRATGTCALPSLVILPALSQETSVRIEKLSRADIVELLADQCFNFASWGSRGLRTLADVARGCEGVRLQFGDLAQAALTIDRLLS